MAEVALVLGTSYFQLTAFEQTYNLYPTADLVALGGCAPRPKGPEWKFRGHGFSLDFLARVKEW